MVLVGGQGTILFSGNWQVVIYKPHHKLLACGFWCALVRLRGSVQPHFSVHCFQAEMRH